MQFPGPVRAVVGLLADAADEAKHLPARAIELPMLAVSTALQVSLRAQQRYARLAARGDEVLHRRKPSEQPPAWATFDESPVAGFPAAADADAAGALLDDLFGPPERVHETSAEQAPGDEPAGGPAPTTSPVRKAAAKAADTRAPAKKSSAAERAAARKAAGKNIAARKAAAKKAAGNTVETATPDGAAASTAAASTAAATDGAATESAATDGAVDESKGKTVSRPRSAPPSRFDTVDDD